jgi:hypothetical protein
VPGLKNAIPIGATMGAVLLTLGVGFWKGPGPMIKEIRRIEARVSTAGPANAVSSASALVAVLVAWRSFTGYRRTLS